jgi:hypothetical protein
VTTVKSSWNDDTAVRERELVAAVRPTEPDQVPVEAWPQDDRPVGYGARASEDNALRLVIRTGDWIEIE